MNIIKRYPADMDKTTTYRLLKSPKIKRLSDYAGSTINIKAWIHSDDLDNTTGELRNIISIMDDTGEVMATNSGTFVREFLDMIEIFGENLPSVEILQKRSKNGRNFITAALPD